MKLEFLLCFKNASNFRCHYSLVLCCHCIESASIDGISISYQREMCQ